MLRVILDHTSQVDRHGSDPVERIAPDGQWEFNYSF